MRWQMVYKQQAAPLVLTKPRQLTCILQMLDQNISLLLKLPKKPCSTVLIILKQPNKQKKPILRLIPQQAMLNILSELGWSCHVTRCNSAVDICLRVSTDSATDERCSFLLSSANLRNYTQVCVLDCTKCQQQSRQDADNAQKSTQKLPKL